MQEVRQSLSGMPAGFAREASVFAVGGISPFTSPARYGRVEFAWRGRLEHGGGDRGRRYRVHEHSPLIMVNGFAVKNAWSAARAQVYFRKKVKRMCDIKDA